MWIQTDAAFDPKTKRVGLAFLVFNSDQVKTHKFLLDQVEDNHEAEFISLILALRWLRQNKVQPDEFIQIKTDSKIVFQSIEKQYSKHKTYQIYLTIILKYLTAYPLIFVKWIPENENRAADQAAKQALHKQGKYTEIQTNYFLDQN